MSDTYNLEPPPTAKVLLKTTAGEILLELFGKQTPKTTRNFLQLCLDGYYDGTIFHRLVPKFIIQGGDPTGTGQGGESSYDGEPFEDEFHSRLKFTRRGLLGMANTGKDDNGSQFFLTLAATPELQGRNTMFGRVVGDTIYNLMKMAEGELEKEDGDRPLYPEKVIGTEILVNPFEDMVKRERVAKRTAEEQAASKKKQPKRKAGKAMLSFGGDDEGDFAPVAKKAKFNTKLVSAGQEAPEKLNNTTIPKAPPKKSETPSKSSEAAKTPVQAVKPPAKDLSPEDSSDDSEPEQVQDKESLLDRTNAQIAALKASMKRNTGTAPVETKNQLSALEAMMPTNVTRGRKRRSGAGGAKDDQQALDLLKSFRAKLEKAPSARGDLNTELATNGAEKTEAAGDAPQDPDSGNALDDDAALCDLHFVPNCQSCSKWDAADAAEKADEDENDTGWMSHALSFAKDRMGKDLEWKRKNEQELVVIDPRDKAKELGVEKQKGKGKRARG